MQKIKRFIHYYKPYKGLFALDIVCTCLISGIDIAFPLFTQYMIKQFLPRMQAEHGLLAAFCGLLIAAVAVYCFRALMQFIITYWGHRLGNLMETDMRRDIFRHIQTLPFSFYDKVRTGKLLSRVTGDLFEVTELAHHGPEDILISCLTIIGAFIAMFYIEWRIALSMLIILPPLLFFVVSSRVKMRKTSKEVKEKTAVINADVESSISGARTAKAFANEKYEVEKFERGNTEYKTAKKDYYKVMAVFMSSTDFCIAMFNIVVLASGGYLIYRGSLDPLLLVTFMLYVSAFTSPIKKLANFAEQYVMGMAGFTRFLEIMDTEPDIKDKPGCSALKDVKGKVEFKDISFSYDEGEQVLSHVNLCVPAGKTLALVGPSGGGKTTLCHLLLRFYELKEGSILLDSTDIRDVTMESLRNNIGIVQQEVFLFADTVMENIRYGRLGATDEEVMEAAKRAHIHEEIMHFADGYKTNVGERGMLLSGGQKQRISIARLFLKNPPVLILDEATSALDTVTESDIQKTFDALAKGRTTIVIAHRLSTVKNADEIAVIDDKRITERGTHEELLKSGGLYAKLYSATQEGAEGL